jgi:F0F1-type ATP synthase membrane subunit b/b'
MNLTMVLELISTVGFPIAAVFALAWFVYKIYKASEKREEQLRQELKENREINRQFAEIISKYSVEITEIKSDIKEIKEDVMILTEHMP